jgi:hypothetical protein
MLNTNSLTSTPDPHRLLGLGRLRLRLARPVRRDRRTPTLLFLSIGQERRVRARTVPPKPVDHLDRAYRCVGTMKEHKQSSKVDRISARIMRRCGHRRSVTGYRNARRERVPGSAPSKARGVTDTCPYDNEGRSPAVASRPERGLLNAYSGRLGLAAVSLSTSGNG